jgi:hypothetical protein
MAAPSQVESARFPHTTVTVSDFCPYSPQLFALRSYCEATEHHSEQLVVVKGPSTASWWYLQAHRLAGSGLVRVGGAGLEILVGLGLRVGVGEFVLDPHESG